MTPPYRALVLDIDGTLIGDTGKVEPYTVERIQLLQRQGTPVFIATGRSESFLTDVTRPLGIETPVICYNGAAIFDPVTTALNVTHPLAENVVRQALDLCRSRSELYAVCMLAGMKFAAPPRSAAWLSVIRAA